MLGLKKCSEEDFHEFVYSNSTYHPEDIDGKLLGALTGIFIFLGIGYCYLLSGNMKYPHLISILIIIFIITNIFFFILSRVNKKKYAFKFQKFMVIIIAINWFVFSIVIYPLPLIIAYYENKDNIG